MYIHSGMKPTTTIRVGLPNALYLAIRTAAKKTGGSVAGLARSAIEKLVPEKRIKPHRPAKRFNELKMKR
jgi:hypothetical protein